MADGVLAVPSGYAVEDATVTPMDNSAGSSANLGR
jgi:bacillopeptidase F (M6 metalloprotease family)